MIYLDQQTKSDGSGMKPNVLIVSKSAFNSLQNLNTTKYIRMEAFVRGEYIGLTTHRQFRFFPLDSFLVRCLYIPKPFERAKTIQNLAFVFFAILTCTYRHYFVAKYDVIIAREPQFAGPLAAVIRMLTGSKLITELNGNYANPFVWEDIRNPIIKSAKQSYSRWVIPKVLRASSAIKSLYPEQHQAYESGTLSFSEKMSFFHEYTPLSSLTPTDTTEPFIMSMGHPYNIKGFDILIQAFNRISEKHPSVELHLVGYTDPDEAEILEKLRAQNSRIKILRPLPHGAAMEKLSRCMFFVLASRTEAMGRVLLEAMALKKAVIGSAVDGIPTYVKNNVNGLLVPPTDIPALAEAMDRLIRHPEFREELAEAGFRISHAELSEDVYLAKYLDLINTVLKRT